MVHDFTNVLTPILMSCSLLRGTDFDEGVRERLIQTIETSARRSQRIIREVMQFLNRPPGRQDLIEFRYLFRAVEQAAKEAVPGNLRIRGRIPEDLWLIQGDVSQLNELLMGFCVSAGRLMPSGGSLDFTAQNVTVRKDSPEARALNLAQGNYLAVKVNAGSSGAPGPSRHLMRDLVLGSVCERREFALGLTRVQQIVEEHRGAIDFEAAIQRGESLGIYLPAEARPEPIAGEIRHPELPQGKRELVLVAEDEAVLREAVTATLERYDYRVASARDGAEALLAYTNHRGDVAAVLMDLVMPNVDGFAAIEALRREDPGIRIIATSPAPVPATSRFQAFLPKPYTAADLLYTLRKVLDPQPSSGEQKQVATGGWTQEMEEKYWELSRLEVLQRISSEGGAELEALTQRRRELKYPRMADEIANEKRQHRAMQQLLNALNEYIRVHESSN